MEGKTRRRSGTPGSGGVPSLEALFSVSFEHVGKAEALAAHAAGVGLLSGMCPAVALHVGPTGEAFAADLTDERFLSGMGLHVFIKILFHVEVLAAPLAHELLVPDVDAHVRPQLVLVLEPFMAVLTFKGFLPGVLQRVDLQRHATFEGFPAGLTCERHVLCVRDQVLSYVSHCVEFLLADVTRKFFLCVTVDDLVVFVKGPELLKGLPAR